MAGGTSMKSFASAYAQANGLLPNSSPAKGGRNKHGAKKTNVDGITFHSRTEARFYTRLNMLLKARQLVKLELQPKFMLQEEFIDGIGEKHKPIYYVADFKVTFPDGRTKVYDTKGDKTPDYVLKKKMFIFRYRDEVFEEVFFPDEHPVVPDPLLLDKILEIRSAAKQRSTEWENKYIKK
ncbi:MAG: DUF1064 domain-containing protein [Paludibacter sp.]|nr:DUF1064 domain-containing protein [Paludibacter sp.]